MRHLQRVIAACLVVLITVQATGCMTWKTVTVPAAVAKDPERKVRLVLRSGMTVTADSVKARADSVVTYRSGIVDAVPLAQVKAIQMRPFSDGKTVGVFVGILAILAALLVALGMAVRAAD